MNLSSFFQILDMWTPTPVENAVFLLIGILPFAIPVVGIIVLVLVIRNRKKRKNENINQQNDNINENSN